MDFHQQAFPLLLDQFDIADVMLFFDHFTQPDLALTQSRCHTHRLVLHIVTIGAVVIDDNFQHDKNNRHQAVKRDKIILEQQIRQSRRRKGRAKPPQQTVDRAIVMQSGNKNKLRLDHKQPPVGFFQNRAEAGTVKIHKDKIKNQKPHQIKIEKNHSFFMRP